MTVDEAGLQLIAAGVAGYLSDVNKADSATTGFYGTLGKADGAANGFQQVITGALREVGAKLVEFGVEAAKAIGGFVKDSIGLAGDFEQGMSVLQATSGATTEEMEQLAAKAKELGSDLSLPATSAVDAGKAMLELAKAGFTAEQQMDATKGVLQLSAAAQIDEAKAAEINANALQAFGLAAKESMFVSDLLAASANASSINATDMADTYKMAGAIFSAFQGPVVGSKEALIDLTTAASLLGNAGIKGSDAGTALKQSLLQLTAPSDKAKGLMKDLAADIGVAGDIAYDAAGNMRSFPEILGLVSESTKNLSEEQRNYIVSTIFGADASRAILILMQQGPEAWDKMTDAVTRQGAAQDLAAAQTKGWNGALEGAKSQIETLQLTIGQALTPILADLLNTYVSPAISAFTDWASAILSADDPIQALITSIDGLLPGFQSFVSGIQGLVAIIGDNLDIVIGFGAALGTFTILATVAGWVSSAIAAFTALGGAVTAAGGGIAGVVAVLGGPVTLAIGAVALAVGALTVAWQNNWGDIQGKTAAVWATLEPIFKTAADWLGENIPKAIETLAEFWTDTLQPALKEVWKFLNDKVFPILDDLVDIYIAAAKTEVQALADLWSTTLQPALKTVWSFITDSVIPIFKALFEVNWAIATKAVEAMAGLWEKVLQPAFAAVGDYITETVVPALTSVGDYLSQTLGPILADAKKWLEDITGGFGGVSGAVEGVVEWLGKVATAISSLKLPDWLTPGSPTPWETALRGIGSALQFIGPGLDTLKRGIGEIGAQITDTFQDTDIVDMLTSLGQDAMDGFGAGLKRGLRSVTSIIDSTADTVEDAFKGAFDAHSPAQRMVPVGEWIIQGMLQGMQGQLGALKDFVSSFGDDLANQMQSIAEQVQGVIADAFGATASIDRTAAANLDKLKDVLPQYLDFTKGALAQAQQEAMRFADPTQGAKYFALKSKQILEYAKLQKDLAEAESETDKERIRQQMLLINAAQSAELAQFNANQQGQTSPTQDIASQINAIMMALAGQNLTDDQIHMVDALASLFGQLSQPQANPYANPVMTMPSTTSTTNLNMPIYTNQSPQVMQDSMAVMMAGMY